MKITALIIGVLSGVIGFFLACFTLFAGGFVAAFGNNNTVAYMGFIAIILTLLIIIFSSLIYAKPKVSGILLIGTSIGAIISGGTLVAVTSSLTLISGIMAYIIGLKDNQTQTVSRNSYITWGISCLITIISISLVASSNSNKTVSNNTINLSTAQVSNISPTGTLADMFALDGNNTDLQRDNKIKEITGKVIQWTLPVFEVSKNSYGYQVQTTDSDGYISTFITLNPTTQEDINYINALKTGDSITFKGLIAGATMRSLNINPAILIKDVPSSSNAVVNSDSSAPANSVQDNSQNENVTKGVMITGQLQTNGNGQNLDAGDLLLPCQLTNQKCSQIDNAPSYLIRGDFLNDPNNLLYSSGCHEGDVCQVSGDAYDNKNGDFNGDYELKNITLVKKLSVSGD